ncbi:hypothetical protein [Haloarcula nitratireducens]|uniref:Uncharacterized protein n=1 Tax=Haloarcula nitratireducens TaxID=2487749 RepID=A0AAW4PJG2_9EURY|nr:hypothetical protein [Halomicroarcula nitratireducens]MBX0297505.1 hypothetical protein [Halomicroarcula nitratireducens]
MEFATWIYPWDILEEGPEAVETRLQALGIGELNLATNYHTVQAFTPHNPERRTIFARASSYFDPGQEYGALEPVPYEGMDGDWVAEIAERLTELDLTSWTVGCHNSRLGLNNRQYTLESAYGDDLVFGLCPSQPAVRTYLATLVEDIASREGIGRVELETFDYFYGTGFGWHHQKIHARLGTLGEFLFGLCFCPHCQSNASAAGVDVDQVRETVVETLDGIIDGTVPHDCSPEEWLDSHAAVSAYVDVREQTLTSLYAELATAAGETPLGYYVGVPDPGREWMVGADLDELSRYVDYYCLPAYESTGEEVMEQYGIVDDIAGDVPIHVGLLPGHPAVSDEATVVDMLQRLSDEDVPRVSFYNYGLLPESSLEWVGNAIDAIE